MIAVWILLGLIVAFGLFYKFIFLRDNAHNIPDGNNIVSPSSGKIVAIEEFTPNKTQKVLKGKNGEFGKIFTDIEADEPYWLISIFMSPLDVHIQKMPLAGTVKTITHVPGKFLPVNTLEAGLVNEKREYLLDTKIGDVKVIQVAGFLARRTRAWVNPEDSLQKGDRMGIILLGSQTILLVPKNKVDLTCAVDDRVSAGETILGNLVD